MGPLVYLQVQRDVAERGWTEEQAGLPSARPLMQGAAAKSAFLENCSHDHLIHRIRREHSECSSIGAFPQEPQGTGPKSQALQRSARTSRSVFRTSPSTWTRRRQGSKIPPGSRNPRRCPVAKVFSRLQIIQEASLIY